MDGTFITVKNGEFTDAPFQHGKTIWRVWSVFPQMKEDLQKHGPIHLQNSFMEDYMHDWNVKGGKFRMNTRTHDRGADALLYIQFKD